MLGVYRTFRECGAWFGPCQSVNCNYNYDIPPWVFRVFDRRVVVVESLKVVVVWLLQRTCSSTSHGPDQVYRPSEDREKWTVNKSICSATPHKSAQPGTIERLTSGNDHLSERHVYYYQTLPHHFITAIPARDVICVDAASRPIVASRITYVSSRPDSGADVAR